MAARGLGKGLDSLIPNALGETKTKKEVVEAMGYKVIYIWEHETKTTEDLLIKLIIKRINNAKIGNNTESTSAP